MLRNSKQTFYMSSHPQLVGDFCKLEKRMIPGFLLQEGSIAVLRSLLQTGITISSTFSYYSVEKESVDCDEAKRILELLHIPLTLYSIPFIADELMDSELKTEIIQHNNA